MVEETKDNEAIITKIKKLLALARKNSNVNEAAAAAAKAQELIMAYNLSESEVDAFKTRDERITEQFYTGHRSEINEVRWKVQLAWAVGKNNLCMVIHHPSSKELSWVGKPSNVEIAIYLYEALCNDLEAISDKLWKDLLLLRKAEIVHSVNLFSDPSLRTINAKSWKKSFYLGAVKSISARLTENLQNLRTNQENINALVVVNDTAINQFIKDRYGRLGRGKSERGRLNGSAYATGIDVGKRMDFKRGMGAGGAHGPGLLGKG